MSARIDLHRHLDGNIRIQTILDLAEKNEIKLPARDAAGLLPHVTITTPHPGLISFLKKFRWPMAVLSTPADCGRIAYENVEDAKNEQLEYVELRFSPCFMASAHGLDPAEVVQAVAAGISRGVEDFGVRVELIGILSRTYGPQVCLQELEALLSCRDKLIGLDLAGDEAGFPARLFERHFQTAREAGLRVTVHAGEAAGPESIREAIDILGATRIGHGVRAMDDPELMNELLRRNIGIECCLTSNVQTSTVESYAAHPLRTFLDRGLLATINTDDPGISNITLAHEYDIAAPLAGLTSGHLAQAETNAALIAWNYEG